MGFSRQEYWSGLPFPSPGDLPDPGSKSVPPVSPALAGSFFFFFFTTEPPGKPIKCQQHHNKTVKREMDGQTNWCSKTWPSMLVSPHPSTSILSPCLCSISAGTGLISAASIQPPSPPSLQHRTPAQGTVDVGPNELTISFHPYGDSQMLVHLCTA